MFEWAEKAADWLPAPDVSIALEVNTQSHPVSRDVVVVFD